MEMQLAEMLLLLGLLLLLLLLLLFWTIVKTMVQNKSSSRSSSSSPSSRSISANRISIFMFSFGVDIGFLIFSYHRWRARKSSKNQQQLHNNLKGKWGGGRRSNFQEVV